MVGDIDFIFSKEDYPKAIAILIEFGYYIKVLHPVKETLCKAYKKR